jgi:protein SCO1
MNLFARTAIGMLIAGAAGVTVPAIRDAMAGNPADAHAHHRHMAPNAGRTADQAVRSSVDYRLPDVQLVRADGKTVLLPAELNDGRAVVLNFIFTTCTGICPVTSQIFSELQGKLGASQNAVRLVSISIDPLQDTPAVLRSYAKKFGAGDAWQFYTGTVEASIAAQRAFGVYRGDKMNHAPVTLLRTTPGKPWVRLDGFVTADALLHELRQQH